jgi:hypothetical protein
LTCKFATTIVPVDTKLKQKDIFNVPTEIVVTGFSYVPGIGYFVEKAYQAENRRFNVIHIKPPADHSSYVYCDHALDDASISPLSGEQRVRYGWTYIGLDQGTFAWKLTRPEDFLGWTLFTGDSWFKVTIKWKAVHPEYVEQARSDGICRVPPGNLPAPY